MGFKHIDRTRIKAKKSYDTDIEEDIDIYEQAKNLIEKKGIEDYVLELRQISCMGGAAYEVTHKDELDKEYVGYKGFYDYDGLCERIKHLKSIDIEKRKKEDKKVLKNLFKYIKELKNNNK